MLGALGKEGSMQLFRRYLGPTGLGGAYVYASHYGTYRFALVNVEFDPLGSTPDCCTNRAMER